ncbi:hypothetical protein PHYSODRAFT_298429 [Phytophthora sojae]|uniref:STI1 domain-containing protein n=1 Tax=Phytophthora sojae (strain P6497) TaxID=1094619 RepID=G4Z563_PHYSP|nr:hypothetical protein PHYSODRAFT_298429 [Phytophthora sojae]EGZ20206.1 hypothetical protein PHYSODRAFT_298429 [Phytophthora sojae]|eukprot:XP_009522923.1 hypothetical protein PHYSODRAFT_298429 [Phytophthora sojae]
MVDHASVNDKNAEREERGIFSSVLAKIKPKDLSSKTKSTGLSNKINNLRKDPDVAAALGNSPVMKKLETAVENDPKFFTKLANNPESIEKLVKNPEVQQAAAALEKSKFKVTQNDINQLGTVVSKNPSKRAMLITGLEGLEKLLWMGAVAGM